MNKRKKLPMRKSIGNFITFEGKDQREEKEEKEF